MGHRYKEETGMFRRSEGKPPRQAALCQDNAVVNAGVKKAAMPREGAQHDTAATVLRNNDQIDSANFEVE